jgi:hypothetical protein
MSTIERTRPKAIDWPLGIGLALTVAYYAVIMQPYFHGTLLHRYTTQHLVEYVVVTFFLWGMVDALFHVAGFPREWIALRQEWCPRRSGREPAARASAWLARLRGQPTPLRTSRIGQRYLQALTFVDEQGSAEGLAEHLRHLADDDYERTQSNYALLRFICWVMPMFGFLGTVVHFGSALAGQTATSIADNLPHVVSAMGTAFNTTTAALAGATTMMFAVFFCERIERGIIMTIDDAVADDLLNRFEAVDASVAPFLEALRATNDLTLEALEQTIARQTELSAHALSGALEALERRFDDNDLRRDERFAQIAQAFETQARAQLSVFEPAVERLSDVHVDLARFTDALAGVVGQHRELLELQAALDANLKLLRETRHIDQAVHGLTAAIHLLTARAQTAVDSRAA